MIYLVVGIFIPQQTREMCLKRKKSFIEPPKICLGLLALREKKSYRYDETSGN